MTIKLDDMMLFSTVVEKASFTKAAHTLGISKSIVSKRLTRLEKQLDARLLNRSTRKLSLTEVGNTLYEHCVRISEELEEAERSVSHLQAKPTGLLKIHSPLGFGHTHLVPAIAEFIKQYPDISVDLSLGGNMDNLIEGGYDLAIYIGQPPESNLICRQLARRGMRVCASPAYLKKHGTPPKPEDLKQHNCLIYQELPNQKVWRFIDKHSKDLFVPVDGNFHTTSSEALQAAALSGMGITMLPGFMMTQLMKSHKLKPILNEYCPQDITIHALYLHSRQLATKVRVFVDFLIDRFQHEDYWCGKWE